MKAFGIRVSNKLAKLGFLDALVGAVFLPKNSEDRTKAIQVLCYLSRNGLYKCFIYLQL